MEYRKEILRVIEETPVPHHTGRDAGKRGETMRRALLCEMRMRISAAIVQISFLSRSFYRKRTAFPKE